MQLLGLTGDPTWDAVVSLAALILGGGGSVKAGAWVKRLLDRLKAALEIIDRLDALEKRQIAHEEKDATDAMTIMGFIDAGEEAFIVQDQDGKTILTSPALAKMIGLTIDEAQNGAWKDVIHPEDRSEALRKWDDFRKAALTQTSFKFRFATPYGKMFPVLIKLVRKRMLQGGVMRIVGLVLREDQLPAGRQDTKDVSKP